MAATYNNLYLDARKRLREAGVEGPFFFGYRHVQERNSDSGSRVLGSERSISRRNLGPGGAITWW